MIELSRTQDEEVGDGTTSVIVLGMHIFVTFVLGKLMAMTNNNIAIYLHQTKAVLFIVSSNYGATVESVSSRA
jgi:T-complex protein 1 subunit gamma